MEHFAYSFLVSMLHSLWQAALLFMIGKIIFSFTRKQAPLQKRNFLLALMATQVGLTGITFYIIYNDIVRSGIDGFPGLDVLVNNSFLQSWSTVLFLLYTLFILARSLYLFFSWKKFIAGHRPSLQKPPIHLRLFTAAKTLEFGIHKKVLIWCSEKITTPVTYGFLRPVILLPIALVNQLTIEETETLIIHELTHIKNKDYLWNWMVIFAEIVFFFNPFIYYIARQVKQEREKSCDVQVIHFKYSPLLYAEALLKTAKTRQASLSLHIGAVKSNNELLKRIHFFSKSSNFNFQKQNNLFSFLLMSLFLVLNIFLVSKLVNRDIKVATATQQISEISIPKISREVNTDFVTNAVDDSRMMAKDSKAENESEVIPAIAAVDNDANIKVPEQNVDNYTGEGYAEELPQLVTVAHELPVKKETREVLIKETNSDGDKIVIAMQAELTNGQWVMQPLWMINETKIKLDSTIVTGKDSMIRVVPSVQ